MNTLRSILNTLENLLEAVDGADAAPRKDARARLALVKADAESALREWIGIGK